MTTPSEASLPAAQQALYERFAAKFDAASDIPSLRKIGCEMVRTLLQRESDAQFRQALENQMSQACENYSEKPDRLHHLFKEIARLVISKRPEIAKAFAAVPAQRPPIERRVVPPPPEMPLPRLSAEPPAYAKARITIAAAKSERPAPADALVDPMVRASDVNTETPIAIIAPPEQEPHESFEKLFPAALTHRVREALTFFQRYNPGLKRELPPAFLLSPVFDAQLEKAITTIIAPKMLAGRAIGLMATSCVWKDKKPNDFWEFIYADPKRNEAIPLAWNAAWDSLRLVKKKRDGRDIWSASADLRHLREMLEPQNEEYSIPSIRNDELELLCSLLLEFNRQSLERNFEKLRQLYEQEMDPRWYQDKARQGALRDSLLDIFADLPARTGEFMAILCYFNFPNLNLSFLEKFTHNRGKNPAERSANIPYLMQFLADPRVPEIKAEELKAERDERERRESEARSARA